MSVSEQLHSLNTERKGTHVDFVKVKLRHTLSDKSKPWYYSDTQVDAEESHALVDAALRDLEAAGRTVLSIAPVPHGYAGFLQTDVRSTSSLGVSKSEELGYGYSYTGSVMIVSRD